MFLNNFLSPLTGEIALYGNLNPLSPLLLESKYEIAIFK